MARCLEYAPQLDAYLQRASEQDSNMASIVFGGMALAAYFSVTRMGSKDACRPGFGNGEAWNTAYQSPSNWLEALYMFAEALRCVYVWWVDV